MLQKLKPYAAPLVHAVRRWRKELGKPRPGSLPTTAARLTPESMVLAYLQGYIPFGKPSGRVKWSTYPERGVIPIEELHVSKRLKTYIRKGTFEIRFNQRFSEVLTNCADRDTTWINDSLKRVYERMHAVGAAHSVEAYQDGELVGGGFGIAVGRVFCIESMYCTVDQASKVAFVKLGERLKENGFGWIDCELLIEHWKRFGAKGMAREELMRLAMAGLECGQRFSLSAEDLEPAELMDTQEISVEEPVAAAE